MRASPAQPCHARRPRSPHGPLLTGALRPPCNTVTGSLLLRMLEAKPSSIWPGSLARVPRAGPAGARRPRPVPSGSRAEGRDLTPLPAESLSTGTATEVGGGPDGTDAKHGTSGSARPQPVPLAPRDGGSKRIRRASLQDSEQVLRERASKVAAALNEKVLPNQLNYLYNWYVYPRSEGLLFASPDLSPELAVSRLAALLRELPPRPVLDLFKERFGTLLSMPVEEVLARLARISRALDVSTEEALELCIKQRSLLMATPGRLLAVHQRRVRAKTTESARAGRERELPPPGSRAPAPVPPAGGPDAGTAAAGAGATQPADLGASTMCFQKSAALAPDAAQSSSLEEVQRLRMVVAALDRVLPRKFRFKSSCVKSECTLLASPDQGPELAAGRAASLLRLLPEDTVLAALASCPGTLLSLPPGETLGRLVRLAEALGASPEEALMLSARFPSAFPSLLSEEPPKLGPLADMLRQHLQAKEPLALARALVKHEPRITKVSPQRLAERLGFIEAYKQGSRQLTAASLAGYTAEWAVPLAGWLMLSDKKRKVLMFASLRLEGSYPRATQVEWDDAWLHVETARSYMEWAKENRAAEYESSIVGAALQRLSRYAKPAQLMTSAGRPALQQDSSSDAGIARQEASEATQDAGCHDALISDVRSLARQYGYKLSRLLKSEREALAASGLSVEGAAGRAADLLRALPFSATVKLLQTRPGTTLSVPSGETFDRVVALSHLCQVPLADGLDMCLEEPELLSVGLKEVARRLAEMAARLLQANEPAALADALLRAEPRALLRLPPEEAELRLELIAQYKGGSRAGLAVAANGYAPGTCAGVLAGWLVAKEEAFLRLKYAATHEPERHFDPVTSPAYAEEPRAAAYAVWLEAELAAYKKELSRRRARERSSRRAKKGGGGSQM